MQHVALALQKADNVTTVTYDPVRNSGDKTMWRESGAANLLAATIITAQSLPVKRGQQLLRKRISFYTPVMEVATAANSSGYTAGPKMAFPITGNFDFNTHMRATIAQNTEGRALMMRVLNGSSTYGLGAPSVAAFLDKDEQFS